jgi:hypothetical protein
VEDAHRIFRMLNEITARRMQKMLTLWLDCTVKAFFETPRIWFTAFTDILALYRPATTSQPLQPMDCPACAVSMESLRSAPDQREYSRCPQCGLLTFSVAAVKQQRNPIISQGIISMEQRRNAKGH